MKRIIIFTIKTVQLIIILVTIIALYLTFTDYKPDLEITISENNQSTSLTKDTFDILSWNIGYAGLGDDMDFFYDGGTKVRTSEERTSENLSQITNYLTSINYDFIILQEVDIKAKRSYKINELDTLNKYKSGKYYYAPNYRVKYVPMPLSNPMGGVEAGLVTYSKTDALLSTRYAFPGNYSWPKNLFLLDRCFLVNRYKTKNNKELLIINTHNSAFDDGSLKKEQLNILKEFIEEEYNKGNYIILGGDWNQNPPNFNNEKFGDYTENTSFILSSIENDVFNKDWNFVYDNSEPTNRALTEAYTEGQTPVTILDFFLLSPNIEIIKTNTIHKNFKNSDHNPIHLKFTLK